MSHPYGITLTSVVVEVKNRRKFYLLYTNTCT